MSDAKAEIASQVFLTQFSELEDRARRVFTESIQALQLNSFVLRGGAIRVNPVYGFIDKHEDLVNAYLTLGGWRLGLDRENGVARLYHPESSGRIRFNKAETTLILVLRLLYHEKKRTVSDEAGSIVTVGEVREKLHSLLPVASVKPFLSRKLIGSALRRLESHDVIAFEGSSFLITNDTKLRLEAVLEYLVTTQNGSALESQLRGLYEQVQAEDAPGAEMAELLDEVESEEVLQ